MVNKFTMFRLKSNLALSYKVTAYLQVKVRATAQPNPNTGSTT